MKTLSIELTQNQKDEILKQLTGNKEKHKFLRVSFETIKCPMCNHTIDISMDYAFENEVCPWCGCNSTNRNFI